MKYIVFILIVFGFISCKKETKYCKENLSLSARYWDKRCNKFSEEALKKLQAETGPCDAVMTGIDMLDLKPVFTCKVIIEAEKKCDALRTKEPAKKGDLIWLSGSAFYQNGEPYMINGELVSNLPVCSKCKACTSIEKEFSKLKNSESNIVD